MGTRVLSGESALRRGDGHRWDGRYRRFCSSCCSTGQAACTVIRPPAPSLRTVHSGRTPQVAGWVWLRPSGSFVVGRTVPSRYAQDTVAGTRSSVAANAVLRRPSAMPSHSLLCMTATTRLHGGELPQDAAEPIGAQMQHERVRYDVGHVCMRRWALFSLHPQNSGSFIRLHLISVCHRQSVFSSTLRGCASELSDASPCISCNFELRMAN